MSSTPTKAEKEYDSVQPIGEFYSWITYIVEIRKKIFGSGFVSDQEHDYMWSGWQEAWNRQQSKLDALEERLRLAEEFIRKKQYEAISIYEKWICIGCEAHESEPCKPDCELQKIIGESK